MQGNAMKCRAIDVVVVVKLLFSGFIIFQMNQLVKWLLFVLSLYNI